MEQIEQLKIMRDAAQVRLTANPDFKLKNSLDALIDDLENFVSGDGSAVNTETDGSDTQEEMVASDDEEEQQSNESYIEDDQQSYNSGTSSYSEVEQSNTATENTEVDNGVVENTDIEENDIAAALAQNMSAEDIDNEQDSNGSDFANSNQLDMEAEAAIEALEAELAQSDTDTRQ